MEYGVAAFRLVSRMYKDSVSTNARRFCLINPATSRRSLGIYDALKLPQYSTAFCFISIVTYTNTDVFVTSAMEIDEIFTYMDANVYDG